MPKENTTDCTQARWRTEVSWRPADVDREGHVQIATVNLDSPFEFPEVDAGDSYQAPERFDGWHVTLDRDGIDRTIEALRKARDAAFPADA